MKLALAIPREMAGWYTRCVVAAAVISSIERFQQLPGEPWSSIASRTAKVVEARTDQLAISSLIETGAVLPSGQILREAGRAGGQYMSCFVDEILDQDSPSEVANLFSSYIAIGGGIGVNVGSWLRQRDASGPYELTSAIGSSLDRLAARGIYRTASLLALGPRDCDVLALSRSLAKVHSLRHLNLSVVLRDADVQELLTTVDSYTPIGRICRAIWETGLPCITFESNINDAGGPSLNCSNPCGEQYMGPKSSCNLGSIDVSQFQLGKGVDYNRIEDAAGLAALLLEQCRDLSTYPSNAHRQTALSERRIGLGLLGFGTLTKNAGIVYGSDASTDLLAEILTRIRTGAENAVGDRDYLTSIAPTGGISRLFGKSSGIEPVSDEIPSPECQIRVAAAAQSCVDNGVSKTVLLSNEVGEADIAALVVLAHSLGCKGISFYRLGCRG
jgi:ribonucleoside-diphosphate reductase alpha chain